METVKDMVRQHSRTAIAGAASLLAVLLAAGCATEAEPQRPESQGFRWAGTGEPADFAGDYQFCRRLLVAETAPARPGLGSEFPGPPAGGPAAKRQFWDCMQSRGWALVDGPPPPSAT
jgi:hypothetical protein